MSAACLRTIFDQSPPLNIPYEFFLVGGAKMSSSKGIGVSARNMADFLPPEILRVVRIRTQPKQPVNFSPDERSVIKIFNDFDRFHARTYHDPKVSPDDRRVYQLSQIAAQGDFYAADFQLVATVAQLPHLDLASEVEKRKGAPLTQTDQFFAIEYVLEDIAERPYITAGFAAFVLLIPLAVTSTRGWIRRLGRRWQRLHRIVYVAAGLGVLHYLWKVKADTLWPMVAAVVLAILLAARLKPKRARRRKARVRR